MVTPRKSRERVDVAALSIREFAEAHGISESFYYKLRKQGLGPDEMKVGNRTMISQEAAARWRRARELDNKRD